MRTGLFGLLVGLPLFLATPASATTINFVFSNGATQVAEGSFTYPTGSTGVLGYSDLSAFSIHFDIPNVSYDLAFALVNLNYQYFAYDTSLQKFVSASVNGTVGAFLELLGSINNPLSNGFFFAPSSGDSYSEYSTRLFDSPYTAVAFSEATATPLPAALPLFASGLGALGLLGWRRKRKAAALAA
jgi:hypothetical protein